MKPNERANHETVGRLIWTLTADANGNIATDAAILATSRVSLDVLDSILSELRQLNQLLACPNFTSIPETLRAIRRQTAPPLKRKRRKRTQA